MKEMKERGVSSKKIDVMLLLLLFSFTGFAHGPPENSFNSEQVLYVLTFFPDSTRIAMMVVFDFKDIAVPINTSLPIFKDLQTAKYRAKKEVGKWHSVFSGSFKTTSLDAANEATDKICEKLLEVFELPLGIIESSHRINNVTGTIETYRKLQYAPYDMTITEKLLRHKPSEGFGRLITSNFLRKYVPGDATSGIEIIWGIGKRNKNADDFYWRLMLTCASSTPFEVNKEIEINLNELLVNVEPVQIHENSKILLEVEKKREFRTGTYSLNIVDISPAGYIEEDRGATILITYLPPLQVENIILKLRISRGTDFDWTSPVIAGAIIIAAIVCTAFLVKKKKSTRRSEEPW
ncbi:MAG: hypothetical protein QMD36_06735 [Candidatus Aenigmarchaeota archaeon]|nr:hypothetical protein [Candidatus Aenigmarchaeota archaeon]